MTYNGIDFNGTSGGGTGDVQYWCNFDATSVWKQQQRFLVLLKNNDTERQTISVDYADAGVCQYSIEAEEYVILDITDLIRVYGNFTMRVQMDGVSGWYSIAITVAGLLDPAKMLIPAHDADAYAYIVPPRMMISGRAFGDIIIRAEFRPLDGSGWYKQNARTGAVATARPPLVEFLTSEFDTFLQYGVALDSRFKRRLTDGVCDERYAAVRWMSATGVTRVHIFALRGQTIATGESYSLQRIDGVLNEVKGRQDSVTLFLDNLDAYDYWYYSDILTSSKVEVWLNENDGYLPALIMGDSVTIPDSGEQSNGRIEFVAKFGEYDAVTM